MIFTGDVAIAPRDEFEFLGFPVATRAKQWCINLEGAVSSKAPAWGVVNSVEWLRSFSEFQLGPIFIGNNHILDVECGISKTIYFLEQHGLARFGAGRNSLEAERPALVQSGPLRYVLMGCGWGVIGCQSASNSEGVNRLERRRVLGQLRDALRHNADRVVVVLHANFEFEAYPQPAHRKLARELIAEGAHAVIFHHSHVVGPIERVDGKPIAYGLGNWAFSYGRYFGGKLKFPSASFPQIALEIGDSGSVVHHARFVPPNIVQYSHAEDVASDSFSLAAEFEGFTDAQYVRWFKENRKKRKLLPIYLDANDSMSNAVRNYWVRARQLLIDCAGKVGLKSLERATG